MSVLSEQAELDRAVHDREVRKRAFAQQSPAQWDEAKRVCLRAFDIVFHHEAGHLSATAAKVQLTDLSRRSEPETRALANHLTEGLSAYFSRAGYWE